MSNDPTLKDLVWLGSSRWDFRCFPDDVKSEMGYALLQAQIGGGLYAEAKTIFKDARNAGIVEVIDDHRDDTVSMVYIVCFASAVYVLHAFQKKSKTHIATPPLEVKVIKQRTREAVLLNKELNE
jgi:phage-related protein